MCGIIGLYNMRDLSDRLPQSLSTLAHRGPDASGLNRFDVAGTTVSLGHRRLSIIDLSAAADQPFVKDGLALTYNGEIYNYREIARDLANAGVRFVTASDTEVLLEAYRHWGVGCLPRLRGMFAFAILELRSGKMLLARDPFGIKPLFVLRRREGAIFASELKAIRAVLGGDLELDPAAIVASLMYYWIPESRCVFRGVSKLRSGSWIEFSPDGHVRSGTFWSPADELAGRTEQPADARSLGEVIRDSVAHISSPTYRFRAFSAAGSIRACSRPLLASWDIGSTATRSHSAPPTAGMRTCRTTFLMRARLRISSASSSGRSKSRRTSLPFCRGWSRLLTSP